MTSFSRKLILATGLVLALAVLSSVAAADPVSQDLVDARQERQIWTTYALSPYLRASNLTVLVQSGMVRLTGAVAEDAEKDLAAEIAFAVTGIQEVNNQIVVQPGYVPMEKNAGRNYGQIVDDAGVTTEVKSKIAWSKQTQGLHAMVDTTLGKVRLRGTADSMSAKNLAGHLAETTRNVTAVDNQLTITGVRPSALESDTGVAENSVNDVWIRAKVQSTLLYSLNAAAANVLVSVSRGDVTLTGKAKNGTERALAIELARNVRGVRSVDPQGYTF
ncbi:BON domain-containing protein [Humidesulfovibrio idahonensis]